MSRVFAEAVVGDAALAPGAGNGQATCLKRPRTTCPVVISCSMVSAQNCSISRRCGAVFNAVLIALCAKGLRKRTYFPMQNLPKISPSRSSAVNSPVIAASAFCAPRNSSAKSSIAGGARRICAAAPARCAAAVFNAST